MPVPWQFAPLWALGANKHRRESNYGLRAAWRQQEADRFLDRKGVDAQQCPIFMPGRA